jgi:hypothetical protein
MRTEPLFQITSHNKGPNGTVIVFEDRIEYGQRIGLRGGGGTEVIPIKSVSSVTTTRDNGRYAVVHVICSGNTIDFRVSHPDAQRIKREVTDLVLGTHPVQQGRAGSPPSPATPPPPVPPPVAPAGWYPDPHHQAAQRYWDGAGWTDHTA